MMQAGHEVLRRRADAMKDALHRHKWSRAADLEDMPDAAQAVADPRFLPSSIAVLSCRDHAVPGIDCTSA